MIKLFSEIYGYSLLLVAVFMVVAALVEASIRLARRRIFCVFIIWSLFLVVVFAVFVCVVDRREGRAQDACLGAKGRTIWQRK